MPQLTLEATPKQAKLLWKCVVGQKARQTKHLVEQLDTYSDLPDALRRAADDVEYLGEVARLIAGYCRDQGVEVLEGK